MALDLANPTAGSSGPQKVSSRASLSALSFPGTLLRETVFEINCLITYYKQLTYMINWVWNKFNGKAFCKKSERNYYYNVYSYIEYMETHDIRL